MNDGDSQTRQERREKKLGSKRERMAKHGKSLARVYKEAILKQINKLRSKKQKEHEQQEL